MKGVVFTEFLGFVAERYGEDAVDDIIDASPLPSGGAYTAVGTYGHEEMAMLCSALAARTGAAAGPLVCSFGAHLSGSFAERYPDFYARAASLFDFLESIEGHIHVDVLKLYPDAELPTFTVLQRTPTRMVMQYRSPRRMSELAVGLIRGSARQFGVDVDVVASPIDGSDGDAMQLDIRLT